MVSVLVTGATGGVGRVLVEQLRDAGVAVRALTRHPDTADFPEAVEVVRGDLSIPDSLTTALAGVERMYLVALADQDPENAGRLASHALELAKQAGVRRVVQLSSSAVTSRRAGSYELHDAVENAIEMSGLEWTFVRPGEFALNKLDTWGHSIRAENVVRSAFPDAKGVPIHEADIAAVACTALLTDGHASKQYTLTGPQALTHREQAAAIAEGLGRDITFVARTYGQARNDLIEAGLPADIAEYILGYQAEYAEEPPEVYPTVEQVTGRPARTLAQWAADHAQDLAAR